MTITKIFPMLLAIAALLSVVSLPAQAEGPVAEAYMKGKQSQTEEDLQAFGMAAMMSSAQRCEKEAGTTNMVALAAYVKACGDAETNAFLNVMKIQTQEEASLVNQCMQAYGDISMHLFEACYQSGYDAVEHCIITYPEASFTSQLMCIGAMSTKAEPDSADNSAETSSTD